MSAADDARFKDCFAKTLGWEGGYSNDPRDPGGSTFKGVTQRAYDGYRMKNHLLRQSVKRMTDDECREIYYTSYWLTARGPDLPPGLDLCQYDECVNSGPVEAARLLQKALGFKGRAVDGVFGLETLAAVKGTSDVPGLIKRVCAARLSFWHGLRIWVYYGKGWTNRDRGVQSQALAAYDASTRLAQG